MLVATICMNSGSNKAENVAQAIDLVTEASEMGAKWVLLPEMFSYHGPYSALLENSEFEHSQLMEELGKVSSSRGITLFAGTVPYKSSEVDQKRVFNSMFVFSPEGKIVSRYDKCHLFNLMGKNGERLYCESDGYLEGDKPVAFDYEGFRIGLCTCYDLRFPMFFSKMSEAKPIDILVVPAAFTLKTGMAHWELLLRARAVESQCFVVASNQYGPHGAGKESFGHSMIIDPWGVKLGDTGAVSGVAYAKVNKSRIQDVREILPALANRRPEIY